MNRRCLVLGGALAMGAAVGFAGAARGRPAGMWIEGPDLPYPVQEIYPVSGTDDAPIVLVPGGFRPGPAGIAATDQIAMLYVPLLPASGTDAVLPDYAGMGWITVADGLPLPLHHAHASLMPADDPALSDLTVIGGYDGGADGRAWIAQDGVLVATETGWRQGPRLPKPVGEAVVVTRPHVGVHLIGGRSPKGEANRQWADQADIADHLFLPKGGAIWERLAPLPLARNSAAGDLLADAIHVVSGRRVADGPTPVHHIYDLKEDRWREATPYPDPHGGLAACAFNGRLYACGGETFAPSPGVVSAQCWSLGAGGAWRREPDMLSPRHGHGLVRFAKGLMAIGGAAQAGGRQTLSSTERLVF